MVKILVIDDDSAMRRTVSRILTSAGHEVSEAQDGVEGTELFRTSHPDIVVIDIFMPRKEGLETILDLRKERPSTLLLAISGGSTAPGVSDQSALYLGMAQGLGTHGMLAKPFRAEDLLREIDKLLLGQRPGA
jgi:CheY-like chemotaxis protein